MGVRLPRLPVSMVLLCAFSLGWGGWEDWGGWVSWEEELLGLESGGAQEGVVGGGGRKEERVVIEVGVIHWMH